jgi:tetratricopeptide (TPR) repeat protein
MLVGRGDEGIRDWIDKDHNLKYHANNLGLIIKSLILSFIKIINNNMGESIKEGVKSYREGRYNEAAEIFQRELNTNSKNPKIWNALGFCKLKTGELIDADVCFENALKYDPDNIIYQKNEKMCLNLINSANKLNNQNGNVPPNYPPSSSRMNSENKKSRDSISAFNIMDIIKGILALIFLFLIFTGSWVHVTNYIENSVTGKQTEIISENAYDSSKVADKLYDEGKYSEALSQYKNALNLEPNSYSLLIDIGRCYGKLKDRTLELASYKQAIALKGDSKTAWNNYGLTLYELDRNEEALEAFNKVLEIDPNDKDAWYNKGLVLKYMGDEYGSQYALAKAAK